MDLTVEQNASASAIRGIVLDYGGVVCHPPGQEKVARVAEALHLDLASFMTRYGRERRPYDGGEFSPREYWSTVADGKIELSDALIDALRKWDVEFWSDIDSRMIQWLQALRTAGFKTGLLSNMHWDMATHARKSFQWLARLDVCILSCELRLTKPGRPIFARCVAGLGLAPQEVLFIDDLQPNVDGAIAAGLRALRFESLPRLKDDLARLQFPLPPDA